MERVGTLIDKLKEQFVQEAGADNMLLTVQMLFSELQERASNTHGKGAVSVMMPGSRISAKETTSSSKPKNNLKKAELSGWLFQMELDIPDPLEQNAVSMELEPAKDENMVEDPILQTQDLLDLNVAEASIVEDNSEASCLETASTKSATKRQSPPPCESDFDSQEVTFLVRKSV